MLKIECKGMTPSEVMAFRAFLKSQNDNSDAKGTLHGPDGKLAERVKL